MRKKREMGELSVCLNIGVCWWTATQTCRHCTVCFKSNAENIELKKTTLSNIML